MSMTLRTRKPNAMRRDVNKEWIALRCLPVNFLDELTITEIGSAPRSPAERQRRIAPLPRNTVWKI